MDPCILAVGHSCIDIIHYIPELPTPNLKISSKDIEIRLGGNSANAALAIANLGSSVDLCTVLGSKQDPFTIILVDILNSKNIGLKCKFLSTEKCPISNVMILENGERVITSYQPDPIVNSIHVPHDITKYDLIMGDTNRMPIVSEVFKTAQEAKIPRMLDVDKPIDNIYNLPPIDHVWFSREAWEQMKLDEEDFVILQKHFGGVIGVTDGANPVTWITNDRVLRFTKPPKVNAINTLGAGDVFKASLAINLCLGKPVGKAIESACTSASEHITNSPLTAIKGEEQ